MLTRRHQLNRLHLSEALEIEGVRWRHKGVRLCLKIFGECWASCTVGISVCAIHADIKLAALTHLYEVEALLFCRMAEVTSLTAEEVIGRSLYQFCHVNDLTSLRHAHIEGGMTSCALPWRYRTHISATDSLCCAINALLHYTHRGVFTPSFWQFNQNSHGHWSGASNYTASRVV